MKNILVLFLIILSSKILSQNDYPKFSTDSTGEKLVVMTLKQAQYLDNSTDLLPLYEKMATQIGDVDSSCIKSLREKDDVINTQDKLIKSQINLINGKNREIDNLNLTVSNYKETEKTYKNEIENKNKEIDLHLKKIKQNKGKLLVSSGIGIVVGFITTIIVNR